MHPKTIRLTLLFCVLAGFGIVLCSCKRNPVSPYRYTVPPRTEDGWEAASLATESMDVGLIAAMFERINDQRYKNIHSVLLVKNGKLVVEECFPGRDSNGKERAFDRDTRHEMHSRYCQELTGRQKVPDQAQPKRSFCYRAASATPSRP